MRGQSGACAGGPRAWCRLGIALDKRVRSDSTKLAEPRPPARENRPQEPRQREHVLPVFHGREHVLLDPFTVQEHALLLGAGSKEDPLGYGVVAVKI